MMSATTMERKPFCEDLDIAGNISTQHELTSGFGSDANTQRTNTSEETLVTDIKDYDNGDYDDVDIGRCFSYSSVAMVESEQYNQSLEPPAWKPPEQEEIDYTDAWNNAYGNNQSHFLQPFPAKDDSTIGSNSNPSSMFAYCGNSVSSQGGLRPRGFSLHSNNDSIEISTQPQLHPQPSHYRHPSLPGPSKPPQHEHRRQPSLPKNIFSSQPTAYHPLLPPAIVSTQSTNKQHSLAPPRHEKSHQTKPSDQIENLIEASTQHTPYEINSSHHSSQVLADAALVGLTGSFIDLYAVDRSVDAASTGMLTKKDHPRERKTALGTLHDAQCILEMHRVDKLADRFKVDLQMPIFVEEDAWVHDVYKDLRKIDVEMELYKRRRDAEQAKNVTDLIIQTLSSSEQREEFHFDLSDSDDEGLGGERIIMRADSLLTEDEPYRFFDPHETSALQSNRYHESEVCASVHDDLQDVIELLKTDAEIDGTTKCNADMDMIRPLLVTDQEVKKWKETSALQELWSEDLKALYAIDVEIDRAKKRMEHREADSSDTAAAERHANVSQDVKEELSRHILNVSQPFCPTSPEEVSSTNVNVPSGPLLPTFTEDSPPKRSIFSQREKDSALLYAQRGTSMMPDTTTVVTKGGQMIDGIPIGKLKF